MSLGLAVIRENPPRYWLTCTSPRLSNCSGNCTTNRTGLPVSAANSCTWRSPVGGLLTRVAMTCRRAASAPAPTASTLAASRRMVVPGHACDQFGPHNLHHALIRGGHGAPPAHTQLFERAAAAFQAGSCDVGTAGPYMRHADCVALPLPCVSSADEFRHLLLTKFRFRGQLRRRGADTPGEGWLTSAPCHWLAHVLGITPGTAPDRRSIPSRR